MATDASSRRPDTRASGGGGVGAAPEPEVPFWREIVDAMSVDVIGADGDALTISASRDQSSGRYWLDYRLADRPVGIRSFTLDQRTRRVLGLSFELDKYEKRYRGVENMVAIHQRLLENLRGSDVTLTAAIGPDESWVWADHYAWAPEHLDLNTANVRSATERIYDAVRVQTVWDATDLPERVQLLGGPRSWDPEHRGSWDHLIRHCGPAELLAGLEQIQPNLGRAVFGQISCWYGQRTVN